MAETVTRTVLAADLSAVLAAAAALNSRIAKKGLGAPIVVSKSDPYWRKADDEIGAILGRGDWVVDVSVDVVPVVLPGGWTLVALAQFGEAAIPLVTDLADTGLRHFDFDGASCDACGTKRDRKTVFVVDGEDGARKFVGSTCVRDFLGHDAARVLALPGLLSGVDDLFEATGGADATVPTSVFVATAWAVTKVLGWHRSGESDSTKYATIGILRLTRKPEAGSWEEEVFALLKDPATLGEAAAAIDWAKGIDPQSSFDDSLKALASEEWVGPRGFGVLAYLPTAHARFLDREAARAVEAAAPVAAAPEGRVVVTGTVVGLKWQDSEYGTTLKWTVRDDRGFRVWSTVPSALYEVERGVRVTFTVTLERSRDDETFAFGKRPSKAEFVDEGVAA